MQSPLNEFLTVEQAAEYLKYSPKTIRVMQNRKSIPYHKIKGRVYFKASELEQWLFSDAKRVSAA